MTRSQRCINRPRRLVLTSFASFSSYCATTIRSTTCCWAHGERQHRHPPSSSQRRPRPHSKHAGGNNKNMLPPWGLSSAPTPLFKQGRNFLEECENLIDFLERFRGGAGGYNGGRPDDDDPNDFDRRANNFDTNGGYNYDDDPYYKNDNDARGGYGDDYYSSSTSYYQNNGGDVGGDDDDNYYYDDRGRTPPPPRRSSPSSSSSSYGLSMDMLPSLFKDGDRRIGLSLVGAGSVVTMLGISLFFNKSLLRLGNLLFICGVAITMGLSRTAGFFLKAEKLRATLCLGLGILLVFLGSPVLGMILEIFGLLNLFGNMFPVILAVARTLPGIGPLLNNVGNNNNNNNSRRAGDRRDNDRYYYDGAEYDDNDYYEGRSSSGNKGYYDDGEDFDPYSSPQGGYASGGGYGPKY
ncbi:hypothetical protein ACA910_014550 [Epithemia clementina (nom. ined.)]